MFLDLFPQPLFQALIEVIGKMITSLNKDTFIGRIAGGIVSFVIDSLFGELANNFISFIKQFGVSEKPRLDQLMTFVLFNCFCFILGIPIYT